MTVHAFEVPAVSTFVLRDTVRSVCDANPSVADPADLVALVIKAIDDDDVAEALRQALHHYIQGYVVATRPTRRSLHGHWRGPDAPETEDFIDPDDTNFRSDDDHPRGPHGPVATDKDEDSESEGTKPTKRKIGKSPLVGIGKFLNSREFSPIRSTWILLKEATVEDIRSMVEKRRNMAAKYLAKADWYEAMADEMVAHGVTTFGELPIATQVSFMSGRTTEPDED